MTYNIMYSFDKDNSDYSKEYHEVAVHKLIEEIGANIDVKIIINAILENPISGKLVLSGKEIIRWLQTEDQYKITYKLTYEIIRLQCFGL